MIIRDLNTSRLVQGQCKTYNYQSYNEAIDAMISGIRKQNKILVSQYVARYTISGPTASGM